MIITWTVVPGQPLAAADVFPQADDVARSLHPDQASVIGNTVKKGVNLNTAFTEFFPDIIRQLT